MRIFQNLLALCHREQAPTNMQNRVDCVRVSIVLFICPLVAIYLLVAQLVTVNYG
jgi:hypothetical protein